MIWLVLVLLLDCMMLRSRSPGCRDASEQHEFYTPGRSVFVVGSRKTLACSRKLSRKRELRGHEAGDTAHKRLGALPICDSLEKNAQKDLKSPSSPHDQTGALAHGLIVLRA